MLSSLSGEDRHMMEISGQRLNTVTSELQETVMRTRMQPIGGVFNKFPRLVRDLAIQLDKKIELVMDGEDVELDKSIVEKIGDPLVHLIRNSADHGIESPEIRKKLGKNPTGVIRLGAYHEAGHVIVGVSDDGAGVDGNAVAERALEKELVSPEQVAAMLPEDKVNLIFLPGFSTSDKVTEVSGRGFGMDVVKNDLESIGGLINVFSEPGAGMAMRVRLPLRLAIIPSLIVTVGNERFIIPQANIVEMMRIKPDRMKDVIECVGKADVVRVRDRLLPLIDLAALLKIQRICQTGETEKQKDGRSPEIRLLETEGSKRAVNVVIVTTGAFQYGLVVDELHDSEEIVIKPLGRHLKKCDFFSGGTILGDGHVALIIDIPSLAKKARLISVSGIGRTSDNGTGIGMGVFTNSCNRERQGGVASPPDED